MSLTTMALILVFLVAIWWLMRSRRATLLEESKPARRGRNLDSAFHAVSIKFTSDACDGTKAMAGRRFLASAAPRMPLPECKVAVCNCRFSHFDDRRTGKDRRSPFVPGGGSSGTGSYEQEQRHGSNRRHDDDIR